MSSHVPPPLHSTLLEQMAPAHVQAMVGKSPMKRLGEPDEMAELAAWLCSGSFSTGAVFDLSGRWAT